MSYFFLVDSHVQLNNCFQMKLNQLNRFYMPFVRLALQRNNKNAVCGKSDQFGFVTKNSMHRPCRLVCFQSQREPFKNEEASFVMHLAMNGNGNANANKNTLLKNSRAHTNTEHTIQFQSIAIALSRWALISIVSHTKHLPQQFIHKWILYTLEQKTYEKKL